MENYDGTIVLNEIQDAFCIDDSKFAVNLYIDFKDKISQFQFLFRTIRHG